MTKTTSIIAARFAAACGSAASNSRARSIADSRASCDADVAYDSDRLGAKDGSVLDKLVRCFIEGPLGDRRVDVLLAQ